MRHPNPNGAKFQMPKDPNLVTTLPLSDEGHELYVEPRFELISERERTSINEPLHRDDGVLLVINGSDVGLTDDEAIALARALLKAAGVK